MIGNGVVTIGTQDQDDATATLIASPEGIAGELIVTGQNAFTVDIRSLAITGQPVVRVNTFPFAVSETFIFDDGSSLTLALDAGAEVCEKLLDLEIFSNPIFGRSREVFVSIKRVLKTWIC